MSQEPWRFFLILLVFGVFLVRVTRIEAGHVGVEINLAGKQRGASEIPVRNGWALYSPLSTQIIEFPTYVQTIHECRAAMWLDPQLVAEPRRTDGKEYLDDGRALLKVLAVAFCERALTPETINCSPAQIATTAMTARSRCAGM